MNRSTFSRNVCVILLNMLVSACNYAIDTLPLIFAFFSKKIKQYCWLCFSLTSSRYTKTNLDLAENILQKLAVVDDFKLVTFSVILLCRGQFRWAQPGTWDSGIAIEMSLLPTGISDSPHSEALRCNIRPYA